MMNRMTKSLLLLVALLLPAASFAQLSSNPDKFLGNITTDWPGSMDYDGFTFSDYWNQVTPENGTKWGTVQGGGQNSFYWGGADPAYNYARQKGFPFKFHTFVWGSQFPDWIRNLPAAERYNAIVKWMDAVKTRYPDLEMIDVVNEAIEGHQGETYLVKEALGGGGVTGYDWIVKAFEMAAERWPDAILIYNDFNTFGGSTDQFIDLVKTLRDAGAPIDAYGCQSHELGGWSKEQLAPVMQRIHDELKMPMYITEYDIPDANDGNQNWNYQQHIPLMWEADYCAGVTLWGWFYGKTWTQDGNSGLIRNKQERSALKWLRTYMQTEAAKNAKSPFPGMKKEISVYIKPSSLHVNVGEPMTINVNVNKAVASVVLYIDGTPAGTRTSAPYEFSHTPSEVGYHELKAVVTATDGTAYERYGGFKCAGLLGIDKRFTSLAEIGSTPFAIVNEADGKAFYGSYDQHLGYDVYTKAFDEGNSGYLFRKEACADVAGGYFLRLITPDGKPYSPWGGYATGYLNSQPVTGDCCFILGNSENDPNGKHNGQDIVNGAVWLPEYVAGKGFALKNAGTGKYLKTNDAAKYDEPTYFTLCTLGATTGVASPLSFPEGKGAGRLATGETYYTIDGCRLNGTPTAKGVYIYKGKKIVLR